MRRSADIAQIAKDAENEWDRDAAIRAEFLSKESYVAWRKADARGAARIFRTAIVHPQAGGHVSSQGEAPESLVARQARARQQNVGRRFAGLPLLDIPQS